jgi:hypothetical protein
MGYVVKPGQRSDPGKSLTIGGVTLPPIALAAGGGLLLVLVAAGLWMAFGRRSGEPAGSLPTAVIVPATTRPGGPVAGNAVGSAQGTADGGGVSQSGWPAGAGSRGSAKPSGTPGDDTLPPMPILSGSGGGGAVTPPPVRGGGPGMPAGGGAGTVTGGTPVNPDGTPTTGQTFYRKLPDGRIIDLRDPPGM